MAERILGAAENRAFLLQKVEYTVDSGWLSKPILCNYQKSYGISSTAPNYGEKNEDP